MIFSISNVFIRRPILAIVCSALIALLGLMAIPMMPVAQFPSIAPTRVSVLAAYPGADAGTVERTVTNILEQELKSLEGVNYITSNSNNGSSSIEIVFNDSEGSDLDVVEVQNRVASIESRLPPIVQQAGVSVSAHSTSLLMVYRLYLEDENLDSTFLSNYTDIYIADPIRQIDGVGDVKLFGGSRYAMRVWLDPSELARRELTAMDVTNAIREQNLQVPIGSVGTRPSNGTPTHQIPLLATGGRLSSVHEFEDIVVGLGVNGDLIHIKDVGHVELGSENYHTSVFTDGKPGVGVGIYLSPDTNALSVASEVRHVLEEAAVEFPSAIQGGMVFDTTDFIRISLQEVLVALVQAVILVVLILLLFLKSFRAMFIPAIAIPVSLIGSCALMLLCGLTLNTFTLLACILASGLVVDDAIVVVEAIAAKISEGLAPQQAAIESMDELGGAVISTSLVLIAVFLPVAFFPGMTGKIYQQFAFTIMFTIVFSTFNALTFSPSMSALLLRRSKSVSTDAPDQDEESAGLFSHVSTVYEKLVALSVKGRWIVVLLFGVLLVGTMWLNQLVPSGFIPEEDQGYVLGIVQTPQGSSLDYTEEVVRQVSEIVRSMPEVEKDLTISGYSFTGLSANQGLFFAALKPWEERATLEESAPAVALRLTKRFFEEVDSGVAIAFNAPAVSGLGTQGGFEVQIVDESKGRLPVAELYENTMEIIEQINPDPSVIAAITQFNADTPQMAVNIDRTRLKMLGVQFNDVAETLSTYMGSMYVNDFDLGQQNYQVVVQAKSEFRDEVTDLSQYYVRSHRGEMLPLDEFVTLSATTGPRSIDHQDSQRSILIQGLVHPLVSTGDALDAVENVIAENALSNVSFEWIGMAREEVAAGRQSVLLFGFGIVVVFLVLAALYNSMVDPLIIILTVPLAVFGGLLFLSLRGLTLNLYSRVGMVMLVGLASKNAILIVEYANAALKDGLKVSEAAIAAAQQRVRPIIMTAFSSLMGFLPLVVATGPGAASRWSIGTTVFGGLLVATILSLFVVPVLFVVMKKISFRRTKPEEA